MKDEEQRSNSERYLVGEGSRFAVQLISEGSAEDIDCLAFIVNDLEGPSQYSIELWANPCSVVESIVTDGTPRFEARWLYENWNEDAVLGEIVGDSKPTEHLQLWRSDANRMSIFNLGVAIAREVREAVPNLSGIPFIVDNNHEYDSLVFDAVKAANPNGQAGEWLSHPPPDCE